ncbi:MAG: Excinuclease ABC, C subunit [Parcubacteria group bacterium GW2011_GWB1_43_8]|nr:MAG: Excinuclease ABC, C subunit [Parcubacteria group bacterium GW2011_GWB1_43_8]
MPDKPGVYLFLGDKEEILYVGRATNLKKRVASYFRNPPAGGDPRIKEMVGLAVKMKHYVTETVLESFILEANLIKKYWPKYNIREKDDRSFVYIVIAKADYPKPIIARGKDLEKFPSGSAGIFGPYKSLRIAGEILKIARRIFPYSICKPDQGKSCFHYQIGLCPGICIGAISKEDYQKNINNLILFLSGEKKRLIKKLAKENPKQAESLKHIRDASLLVREDGGEGEKINRLEAYDISHFAGKETYGAMVVFSDGEENKNEYRLFKIKSAPANDDLAALRETIERRFRHKEWPAPDLIVIDGGRPQVLAVSRVLRDNNIKTPMLGISKLGNDKLVFPLGTKKSFQELAEASKNILLRSRDEAHRFANFARKRRKKIDMGL